MIHVERESSKQSENLAAGWISRETFTPSNIRPSPIVARRKKEAAIDGPSCMDIFPKIPQEKGWGTIVRKLKRVVNLVGQENDGRVEKTGWIGTRESASMPTIPTSFFIADKFANASVSLPSPIFSPMPLIILSIYESSFSRVRHDRRGRNVANAFRDDARDESN